MVTKEFLLDLIGSINVKQEFDSLTKTFEPYINLSGISPAYLDGTYVRNPNNYTLYAGSTDQQFILSDKDVWVKDNNDGTWNVIVYTINVGTNLVLNNSFQLSSPMWMLLVYRKNPNHIVATLNHADCLISVKASLGGTSRNFGIYCFPDHPYINYLQ
jgi:hypothetical protein